MCSCARRTGQAFFRMSWVAFVGIEEPPALASACSPSGDRPGICNARLTVCALRRRRLAGETAAELQRMAGRQAAAPMSLPGLSVGALGDNVLRVIEVVTALINPAAAKADPLIQVRSYISPKQGLPIVPVVSQRGHALGTWLRWWLAPGF